MLLKSIAAWLVVLMFGFGASASAQIVPWKLVMQFPELGGDVKVKTPRFLGLDSEKKRYYLVDATEGKIDAFDAEGQFVASFDAAGQLNSPVSMARTSSGKFWIVERSRNQLLYVDIRQKMIRDFTLKDKEGRLVVPDRIALDAKDHLFVLDRLSGSVLQVDDDLKVVRRFSAGTETKGFCDFKVKEEGVFALDCLQREVFVFDLRGTLQETIALKADLMFPSALEVEGADRLYILDRHKGNISVFDRQGELKFDFLDKGKRSGLVSYGAYLLLDWDNRLCVVEEGNGRVEVYERQ